MEAKVLTFRKTKEAIIPTPFNHRAGDEYLHIAYEDADSAPVGFPLSAVYVIKRGEPVDGAFHAINTPDGAVLVTLDLLPSECVQINSCHPAYLSRCCALKDLDILGVVIEWWPAGLGKFRYVLNPDSPPDSALNRPLYASS